MPDKTNPEQTEQSATPATAESGEATEATEAIAEALAEAAESGDAEAAESGDAEAAESGDAEAAAETATPSPAGPGIVAFVRDRWLTVLLAALLVGAIVYGAAFTASSNRWEARSVDLEAQLAETTAAKTEVEAAKAEVEAAKAEVEATNTDLQGDLDECRSTADAADVLVGLDKQAGDKLSAFMDTFFALMATTSEAEAQSLLGTIETQGAEIEALDGQIDAAEKTYDERVGLCRD